MKFIIETAIKGFPYWIKTEYILNREGVANPKHINFTFEGLKNHATHFMDEQAAEKHRVLIQSQTQNILQIISE